MGPALYGNAVYKEVRNLHCTSPTVEAKSDGELEPQDAGGAPRRLCRGRKIAAAAKNRSQSMPASPAPDASPPPAAAQWQPELPAGPFVPPSLAPPSAPAVQTLGSQIACISS